MPQALMPAELIPAVLCPTVNTTSQSALTAMLKIFNVM